MRSTLARQTSRRTLLMLVGVTALANITAAQAGEKVHLAQNQRSHLRRIDRGGSTGPVCEERS
jgi:hypothetical protein